MTFEEAIKTNGKLAYTNKGVSMLPWIHEGKDVIVIERITSELKKYDTVLFIRPNVTGRGRYVLHRILKCYGDGTYYIKGDNTVCGERVKREDIIGILTEIHQPNRIIRVDDWIYSTKVRIWWHILYPSRSFYRIIKKGMKHILRKMSGTRKER